MLDPNFIQPYTYTSREYDPESGLYFYRARYYDAKAGRFISEDPIGLAGGINLFAYVGNNPVNLIDPEGKISIDCGRYVRKYFDAVIQCQKDCDNDEITFFDKYGFGSMFSIMMRCTCSKMGYKEGDYAECLKAYQKCMKSAIKFPPKPR